LSLCCSMPPPAATSSLFPYTTLFRSINEPTAAAICYGLNSQHDQTVLVYDFGGGTLDVTILRIHHGVFEEISSKGIGKLGGDDLDRKSTRLNSSHGSISYAVFCLKKK